MSNPLPEEPAKRPTRAEAKARTRRSLLDAAARTFARKGFAGASVEEIAETAGFSIGAVYSNFGSKERMFVELLSERASAQVTVATQIMADARDGVDDPVRALGRMLVDTVEKDPDLALLQAEFWLYAVRNPALMETLAERMREPQGAMRQLMQAALERVGKQDEVSADSVATVAIALFQGLVRQRRIHPADVPDELLGQAMRWLFAGIAASTPVPVFGDTAERPAVCDALVERPEEDL